MNDAIYTHPSNIGALGTIQVGDGQRFPFDDTPLGGIPIYIDKNLPATRPTGKVKFPEDGNWKFCEFEEKDEEWALALGFATREEEPVYYMVDFKGYDLKHNLWNQGFIEMDWGIDYEKVAKQLREDMDKKFMKDMYEAINNHNSFLRNYY